jgi:predicted ester cyclase
LNKDKVISFMPIQRQEKGETTMSLLRSLVEKHYAQVANQEWDRAAEVFTPDVETTEPGAGTMHGLAATVAYGTAFITAFPDGRLHLDTAIESGNSIVVEGRFTGTHNGPLVSPAGTIPPTGQKLELPYCDVFTVKDERIATHHIYYDRLDFMAQLGLMPGPSRA